MTLPRSECGGLDIHLSREFMFLGVFLRLHWKVILLMLFAEISNAWPKILSCGCGFTFTVA